MLLLSLFLLLLLSLLLSLRLHPHPTEHTLESTRPSIPPRLLHHRRPFHHLFTASRVRIQRQHQRQARVARQLPPRQRLLPRRHIHRQIHARTIPRLAERRVISHRAPRPAEHTRSPLALHDQPSRQSAHPFGRLTLPVAAFLHSRPDLRQLCRLPRIPVRRALLPIASRRRAKVLIHAHHRVTAFHLCFQPEHIPRPPGTIRTRPALHPLTRARQHHHRHQLRVFLIERSRVQVHHVFPPDQFDRLHIVQSHLLRVWKKNLLGASLAQGHVKNRPHRHRRRHAHLFLHHRLQDALRRLPQPEQPVHITPLLRKPHRHFRNGVCLARVRVHPLQKVRVSIRLLHWRQSLALQILDQVQLPRPLHITRRNDHHRHPKKQPRLTLRLIVAV